MVTALVVLLSATLVARGQITGGAVEIRRPGLLVAAAVLALGAVLLNTIEFILMARCAGLDIRGVFALRVTVLSTAANLLPIPGAVTVKVGALMRSGAQVGQAFVATLSIGLIWGGVGLAGGGIAILVHGAWEAGVVVLVAGCASTLIGLALATRTAATAKGSTVGLAVTLLEIVTVLSGAVRIALILASFGFTFSVGKGVALYAAAIVATAVGIFPAGLGLREWLSIGVTVLLGMPSGVGFAVAIADRVVSMPTVAIVGIGLLTGRLDGVTAPGRPASDVDD